MIDTKLILVEGLPGSGKSTTGQFIGLQLQRNDIDVEQWYNEGDMHHPVDFQFEVVFDEEQFHRLLKRYPEVASILQNETETINSKCYLRYMNLSKKYKDEIPKELYKELETGDIFYISDGDVKRYTDFAAEKWKKFVQYAMKSDKVFVFESSILMLPLISLVGCNACEEETLEHINTLIKIIEPLNPVLIYLYSEDIRELVKRVCKAKGKEWIDKVSKDIAESEFGKARNLNGFDGMVELFTYRFRLEQKSCTSFNSNKMLIENSSSNWGRYYDQILTFLQIKHYSDCMVPLNILEAFAGSYYNDETNVTLDFLIEDGKLYEKKYHMLLTPKDNSSFYLQSLSSEITFNQDSSSVVISMTVGGRENEFFFEPGTMFVKI